MSLSTTTDCPHERRPGITICLHCRQAERLATRAHRRRVLGRFALAGLALALLVGAGAGGASALQGRRPVAKPRRAASASAAPSAAPSAPAAASQASPGPSVAPVTTGVTAATVATSESTAATRQPAVAAAETPSLPAPTVAEGRTELGDSVFAVRTGSTVTVHFDTEHGRTRRAEKFERIVRATLPKIYGALADSLLAKVPEGGLARSADLLTELPTRGIHLSLAPGGTLAVWPETRPGRDGPIVVTYRTTLTR